MNICAELNICASISPPSQSPKTLGVMLTYNLKFTTKIMATARRILIKGISKELVAELLMKNYKIDRTSVFDYEYREVFLDKMNYAFILFDGYIENWIELDLDFKNSVDEHDIFLTKLSKEFKTIILFGYSQTTTADTRFLVLENGEITRQYYQKSYYELSHRILMETNFGHKRKYENSFKYAEIGKSIEGFKTLDFYDDIQAMFEDYGYIGEKRKVFDEKYLHLEYII
jgi:hypothetical protein